MTHHQHNSDDPLHVKKVTTKHYENLGMIYLYGYTAAAEEELHRRTAITSQRDATPMDVCDDESATMNDFGDATQTSRTIATEEAPRSDNTPSIGENRKGPDSRTIVPAPETKKSRLELVLKQLQSKPRRIVWDDEEDSNDPL